MSLHWTPVSIMNNMPTNTGKADLAAVKGQASDAPAFTPYSGDLLGQLTQAVQRAEGNQARSDRQ